MSKGLRVNERIRIKEVRVIGPDGAQLGILPIEQALQTAFKLQMDLVEVAPEARPPVCRIMDYGKYRYEQAKKAREAKKKQTIIELKEIKLRPKTEEHDFQFKAKHAERFLKEGNKAKITMMFRGREMVRMDRGKALLDRFVEVLKEVGVVEQAAKVEGRNMTMILAPKH
ncbi:MAG TPA: translation initiation factor IF-3 [Candidatus Methylomirabilis sp.]|nr:translation initiation factor IF-3 [Candidatus Methylomirabilis sp.]